MDLSKIFEILADPQKKDLLKNYLTHNLSAENLSFLDCVEEYERVLNSNRKFFFFFYFTKQILFFILILQNFIILFTYVLNNLFIFFFQISPTNVKLLQKRSQEIYLNFISPTAEKEVNLESNIKKEILKNLDYHKPGTLFELLLLFFFIH